ncbi:FMN-dependent dehydrogenase [Xylariaceae sp. FL0594]|nr:FMN-dependent dehydrogenase [Xylariaceae sp. FL0594]
MGKQDQEQGQGVEADGESPPSYGEYQFDIYAKGLLEGVLPPLTTDPNKLRLQAKQVMKPEAYNYIVGGAGEGATMDANRLAFRQWKIVPRMMRPTAPRDLKVTLFGEQYNSPVLMAPIGVQEAYHSDKELGTARACAELKVPFIMSTASTSSISEVATCLGDSPRWFQLYWPTDDEITASILRTARAAGFKVLVVTLDTATMSWRPADLDTAFIPFMKGQGNTVGFTDPVFRRKFAERCDDPDATPEDSPFMAARYWLAEAFSGDSHPWEHLEVLKRHWDGPIVLKGIQHPDDARLALRHGVDGIIVSNHGGRQVDGAAAALDMLPEIVDAVGDKLTVLYDSGIRTGADIVKALALGAKAVLIGRPVMYGLGIAGKEGAKHVLASLLADLDGTMSLAGFKSVADLNPSILRKTSYSGDVKSSL